MLRPGGVGQGVVLLAVVIATALGGCTGREAPPVRGPSAPATTGVAEADLCARSAGKEGVDGPLNWRSYGTLYLSQTWWASRPMDHGFINLDTTEPIVLDSVTIADQDPRYFAPVRTLGAWVSVDADPGQIVRPGHWPAKTRPLACERIMPAATLDQRVLIVRLDPTVGAVARGRKWAADRGIVVHYHTLDGRPFAAPFGYVAIFPTGPRMDSSKGMDRLEEMWR